MMTLISCYRLRPETDREEFMEWARSVDIPKTRARSGVLKFDMFVVTHDDASPADEMVELFELESEEAFAKLSENPDNSAGGGRWEQLADPQSVRNLFCQRIE